MTSVTINPLMEYRMGHMRCRHTEYTFPVSWLYNSLIQSPNFVVLGEELESLVKSGMVSNKIGLSSSSFIKSIVEIVRVIRLGINGGKQFPTTVSDILQFKDKKVYAQMTLSFFISQCAQNLAAVVLESSQRNISHFFISSE